MTRLVDLDQLSAGDIDQLWRRVEQLHARGEKAELRAVVRSAAQTALAAGRLSQAEKVEIDATLENTDPRAVIDAWLPQLVPDRPALGHYAKAPAFPRRDTPDNPLASEWLAEDPRRLAAVMREMARFGYSDWRVIVSAVTELADSLGIPEAEADRIISATLRQLKAERCANASA